MKSRCGIVRRAKWSRSRIAPTPAAAAQGAEVVWLCVSDTAAVEKILFGSEGVEQSLAEGMIIADSSTISPSATVKFAQRVRGKGVAYVDAPMTGSKIGAANGTLIFMVGGEEAVIQRLNPSIRRYGQKDFPHGRDRKGSGHQTGHEPSNRSHFRRLRRGPHARHKTRRRSAAVDFADRGHHGQVGRRGIQGSFHPAARFHAEFPLRLMHKDILLALEAAKEARVKLPALETVEEIYEMATEDGHRDLDYAATLTLLEKWAGVQVKGEAA